MTGIWGSFRSFAERMRGEFGGGTEWVEPGNWITRAILAGDLGSPQLSRPATRGYELAPDNVLIATSAPRPAVADDAAESTPERVARAG